MAGGFQVEKVGGDGGPNAVVVAGETGAGLQAVDEGKNAGAFN